MLPTKLTTLALAAVATLAVGACQKKAEAPAPAAAEVAMPAPAAMPEPAPAEAMADPAAEVASISAERQRIEAALATLTEKSVAFDKSRPQLQQKWKKMDVHSENGAVVRVKTYPHDHSKRTEEFYFKDGALILAFIEDDGAAHADQAAEPKGKTYWFAGGKNIKEANDSGEAEAGAPGDDAARLQQEANEYLMMAKGS